MEIIAGDIGGTKSWLVWAHAGEVGVDVRFEHVYVSADFPSAEALMRQFMADAGTGKRPDSVCLALPGPVVHGLPIQLTNLDWVLEKDSLQSLLDTSHLLFINDFQAAARGVETLTEADYRILNDVPAIPQATRVITGAGTGLGLAWMQADSAGRYQTFATEGGHTNFSPANRQQERLLAFMRERFQHVSWERVLSGPGVNQVYQFCLQDMTGNIPPALRERNGAEVNRDAQLGDSVANAAMQLFADLYANWVGNIALLYQPRGGLYLGGGISARIQSWLHNQRFLDACFDKGRMVELVRQTPIYLIINTRLGLQGALAAAMNTTY
jgi:glucokinase